MFTFRCLRELEVVAPFFEKFALQAFNFTNQRWHFLLSSKQDQMLVVSHPQQATQDCIKTVALRVEEPVLT